MISTNCNKNSLRNISQKNIKMVFVNLKLNKQKNKFQGVSIKNFNLKLFKKKNSKLNPVCNVYN